MKVKNEQDKQRNISVSAIYYNASNEKIGENGFSIRLIEKGQEMPVESTCYIAETDVSRIELQVVETEITTEKDKDKAGTATTTTTTTEGTTTTTNQ